MQHCMCKFECYITDAHTTMNHLEIVKVDHRITQRSHSRFD
jgi:hypothetical protein